MFATVGKCVRDAADHDARRRPVRRPTRGSATSKGKARATLRKLLAALANTARALAIDRKGFDLEFRMPRGNGDQRLLAVSRTFESHARDCADEFVAHGLPPTFLDELGESIGRFERTVRDRAEQRSARVAAGDGLRQSLDAGFAAVRRLDAIVPNVYRDAPGVLKEWRTARRPSRRA